MKRAFLYVCVVVFLSGHRTYAQDKFVGKTADGLGKQLTQAAEVGQRRSAAYALGKMGKGAAGAVADMKAALASEKDAKVRDAIVFALGEIARSSPEAKADRELEPIFVKALQDPDAHVRRSAAFAIGCIGSKAPATLTALDAVLGDSHAMVRQNAAYVLGQFGDLAIPSLKRALGDADSLVKRDAASSLMQIENADEVHKVVKDLYPLCGDSNSEVRRAALNVLVRIVDHTDKDAIPSLQAVLTDRDLENRRNAAVALTNIGGPETLIALPVLLEAAKDADVETRRQAVLGITNIGPTAAKAVPDLMRILVADRDAEVRRNAALALGGIGKASEPAMPLLLQRMQDTKEDQKTRVKCANALAQIGPVGGAAPIVPSLLRIIEDARDDVEVRERAVWALRVHGGELRKMKGPLETFSKILKEPVNAGNKMLRYDCAYMLGMIWQHTAPDGALDILGDFLADATIKLYQGQVIVSGPKTAESISGKGFVKEQSEGDARVMAADALKGIGFARYSQRADIMKHLKTLADDTKTFPPLRKKAAEMLR